jgi:hypothetical protein
MANSQDIEVAAGSEVYVVRRDGDELRLGRQSGSDVAWEDETIPVSDLSDSARAALDRGDTDAAELRIALESAAEAFVNRGG